MKEGFSDSREMPRGKDLTPEEIRALREAIIKAYTSEKDNEKKGGKGRNVA